jgi:lipid-A-disaccharide synthase
MIVPELPQAAPEPHAVATALASLLDDPAAIPAQIEGFRAMRRLMEEGADDAPRLDPARRVRAVAAQRPSIGT